LVLKNYGLPALITYALLSILFFKFPGLLHRKRFSGIIWDTLNPDKTKKKKLWHISHRGGSRESLENTMEAFEHSVNHAKTDMLEFDIYMTKDKKIVVFHDFDMGRVMGVKKSIEEFDYSEIPKF
jgi:glycerophosphoryl diester phosphodiesterase